MASLASLIFLMIILSFNYSFAQPIDAKAKMLSEFEQNNERMPDLNQFLPSAVVGMFAGETIENDEKRTLIILNEKQKKIYGIAHDVLAFANFRHKRKFYIAKIPSLKVTGDGVLRGSSATVASIYFVKQSWAQLSRPELSTLERHVELHFHLNKNAIQLVYDQTRKTKSQVKLSDATFSIEAIRSNEHRYADFVPAGMGWNFAIGRRFYSLHEWYKKHQEEPTAAYQALKLDFSKSRTKKAVKVDQKDQLLFNAILASHKYARTQVYHMLKNNCTNRLIDLFDETLLYNNDKGLDISLVKRAYQSWALNDLPIALKFIDTNFRSQIGENSTEIGELLNYMPSEIKKFIAKNSVPDKGKFKLISENLFKHLPRNDKRFNLATTGLPMLVDAHLMARGLVARKQVNSKPLVYSEEYLFELKKYLDAR